MSDNYSYLDNDSLLSLLNIHRRNYTYLTKQMSSYGENAVPMHIYNQREGEHQKIVIITQEMQRRGIRLPDSGEHP